MNQTLAATAAEAPREADLAFDRLYRSSRDDVYAYVAGLCATARRPRKSPPPPSSAPTASARASTRAAASRAPGSSGSPATPPSTSCAAAAARPSWRRSRPTSSSAPAHESAEASERRLALTAALATLEARERELIALKFFAGLDNAEIAAVLGVSESNAGTKLHRAVTKLREACDGAL